MSIQRKNLKRAERRAYRVREKLKTGDKARVSVFKSIDHIYAQLIDDAASKTVASCSTVEMKDLTGNKKDMAHAVGVELAKRAKKQGIEEAVFDRGQFLYHGRIKSLAEGLREGGLKI